MSGTLTIGNKEIFSHSDATNKVTYGSGVPADTVIGFKFVEIGNQALSGTYTKFNITSAATSSQGLQVVSTTYNPKSNNSLIYAMANLTVTEHNNGYDEAYAALFVESTNLSQTATQDRTTGSAREYTVANLSGTFTNSSTNQLTVQVRASGHTDEPMNINAMIGDVPFSYNTSYYYKTGLTILEVKQ